MSVRWGCVRRGMPFWAAVAEAAWLLRIGLAVLVSWSVGCRPTDDRPEPLQREGPLGSLRDLVLFDRGLESGGPFFLDRFEVTRADWTQFARAEPESARRFSGGVPIAADGVREGDPLDPATGSLPMVGIDLASARAFAAWRRARLPRVDEWLWAVTTGGRYAFPWGNTADPARANTAELGLGAPLPVGTFESGRRRSGLVGAPYDLIGNVAEWTETVQMPFRAREGEFLSPVTTARRRLDRLPALTLWQWPWNGSMDLPMWVVAAAGSAARREVVGGSYMTPMAAASGGPRAGSSMLRIGPVESRAAEDWSDLIGCRLCASPVELAQAIAAGQAAYSDADLEQLRRFLRRPGYADAILRGLETLESAAATRRFFDRFLPTP